MNHREQARHLLITSCLTLALVLAALLSAAPVAADEEWKSAYGETAGALRTAGLALFEWYFEEREPVEIAGRERHDVTALPVVSAEEVAARLVPARLESLPTADAWGRPLEFRLDEGADGEPFFLVRSAGADGVWDGDLYTAGGVAPGAEGDDLVWADGYFVRWPQPAGD